MPAALHRPRPDPGSAVPTPYVACCTERRRGSPQALSSWAGPMKNYPLEEASPTAAVAVAEVRSAEWRNLCLYSYILLSFTENYLIRGRRCHGRIVGVRLLLGWHLRLCWMLLRLLWHISGVHRLLLVRGHHPHLGCHPRRRRDARLLQVQLLCLLLPQLHLALLFLHPLQRKLPLVLQVLLLLLPHQVQLLLHLNLPLPFGLLCFASAAFPLLLSQGVQSRSGILHLNRMKSFIKRLNP